MMLLFRNDFLELYGDHDKHDENFKLAGYEYFLSIMIYVVKYTPAKRKYDMSFFSRYMRKNQKFTHVFSHFFPS